MIIYILHFKFKVYRFIAPLHWIYKQTQIYTTICRVEWKQVRDNLPISFREAIVPAYSLCPECLSHTHSQHLMFRTWFASIKVRCLSLSRKSVSTLDMVSSGYFGHLSVILILSWVDGPQAISAKPISSTLHMPRVRNVVGPSSWSSLGRRWARKSQPRACAWAVWDF